MVELGRRRVEQRVNKILFNLMNVINLKYILLTFIIGCRYGDCSNTVAL